MNASPHIPEEMRRLYVQRRRNDLAKLTEARDRRDAAVFHQIGHQLKGNAATYGYLDLEAIGIRLEKIKDFGENSEATPLLQEFRAWLERQGAPVES